MKHMSIELGTVQTGTGNWLIRLGNSNVIRLPVSGEFKEIFLMGQTVPGD